MGRDPFLNKLLIGGDPIEGYPVHGIWVEDVAFDDDNVVTDVQEDIRSNNAGIVGAEDFDMEAPEDHGRFVLDEFHEVQQQVIEALDQGDALHEESEVGREAIEEDNGVADNIQDLDDLYTQATTPVYEGSYTSIVSTTIIIMNMCIVFHVSNKFSDELFRFLSTDLLPVGNKLPHTHYEARKSIRRLGLHYNNVHACPNG